MDGLTGFEKAVRADSVCNKVLRELLCCDPDDEILNCNIDTIMPMRIERKEGKEEVRLRMSKGLSKRVDDLFDLADQEIHVFPFKDVKNCWFRLYTDTSIVRAINLLLGYNQAGEYDGLLEPPQLASKIVGMLDMALIMAGGVGREEEIQLLLERVESLLDGNPIPLRKQRILQRNMLAQPAEHIPLLADQDTGIIIGNAYIEDELPLKTTSVPHIQHPIEFLWRPDMLEFQMHMNRFKSPVILKRTMDHWPALTTWKSKQHWLDQTLDGRRLVPIEVGRSYTDDDFGQEIIPFAQFLDEYICSSEEQPSPVRQTGYLAQHDLLAQIPALRAEIATPDYCYLTSPPAEPGTPVALSKLANPQKATKTSHPSMIPSAGIASANSEDEDTEIQTNIWFGPPWTISPLHHDPYHNVLCQVVGQKYFRLYHPRYSWRLHPRSSTEAAPHLAHSDRATENEPSSTTSPQPAQPSTSSAAATPTINMSNTSSVDIAAMELSPSEDWDAVYSGISKIPYVECVLQAGEALYIPIGWWHYVRSCSTGISVSYWWDGSTTPS